MTKYYARYTPETLTKPIFSEAIIETNVKVNILLARLDDIEGLIVLDVLGDSQDEKRLTSALKKKGLVINKIEGKLKKDIGSCIDCGLCVGVCPTDAITMIDYKMDLNNEKCILCSACINTCPVRALSLSDVL